MASPEDAPARIPVLRPLLPTSERLLPYLRRVDETRIYSNWGPLNAEFEQRLCDHFSLPPGSVASASSGTAALVGAILGTAGRARIERPFAVMPAFTFVATAVAAEHCGYEPYFVDVDADEWVMGPRGLSTHPLRDRIGVVIPVAAFGRPMRVDEWREYQARTNVPVVIDGAASFEALTVDPDSLVGDIPVAVSFHATKSLGTGEGGCVVSRDSSSISRIARALNFGFWGSRISSAPSTNGKMSEYHAAVGLAALDQWPETQGRFHRVADEYRQQFARVDLGERFLGTPTIAGCYALFRCVDSSEADRLCACLDAARVDFRFWYGKGLQEHPAFVHRAHDPLITTAAISDQVFGLPTASDLSSEVIARVVSAVATAIRR